MDWDSSATVKSCSNHTTPKQTTRIKAASSSNKGFGYLDALNLDDEDDTFFGFLDHINDQNNGFQELENISSLPSNGDGSHVVDSSRANSRPIQQQVVQYYQPPPLQPQPPATTVSLRQSQLPFHYQWQQWHQGQGSSNVCPVETTQASPSRARNNKKGEKKVFQVAAEDLCSDAWQWRKYGQKPIKGSHFPRNYYRCSSSKACTARKQVERSHVDSKMFKVTYSGEHTAFCPPPNQFPPAGNAPVSQNVANNEPPAAAINGGEIEALSPVEVAAGDDVVETGGGGVSAGDGGGIEGDAEDLLIPNFNVLNDDLLKGFQQLGGTIGGGE